ncbi:twin-arginine translocase subunit TatC [Halostella salina]|uniref:twin-arginine translocase subunit TatC n=1 Tax=Halostella salina TaxID=1547897 RepID=UPI000EF78858|nr:twin-arginine translocase subunit TatC [Halostella salina]
MADESEDGSERDATGSDEPWDPPEQEVPDHSAPGADDPIERATPDAGSGGQSFDPADDVDTTTPPGTPAHGGPETGTGVDEEVEDEWAQPPDDEELPLAAHIEEMVKRLGVVVVIAAIVTSVAFPFAENFITTIWYHIHPGTVATCPGTESCAPPHVYGPLELKLAELKLASLAGLVLALPVFVYETYLFMRPGLYPQERRYYLAAVPTSLVLALFGVAFAYFLVLPALFTYFLYYSQATADIAFALRDTFNLILMMMGTLALVFQIPLFIMLAIMMGITTRQWLADRRLYFWGGFLGIAFIFSPDPTGMAPILVASTMVILFEGTLFLLRWVGR